jgi:hypothetical protein
MDANAVIEKFSKYLTVFSAAVLSAATAHEWGYFLVVGREFLSFFSFQDYILNALLFLPSYVGLILLGAFIAYVMHVFSKSTKRYRFQILGGFIVYRKSFYLMFLGPPAIAAGYAYFVDPITLFLTILIFFVAFAVMAVSMTLDLNGKWPIRNMRLVHNVIMLLVFTFGFGLMEAQNDLFLPKTRVYTASFKRSEGGDAKADRNFHLLRTGEKGLLINDPVLRKVEFVRFDGIASVASRSNVTSAPFSCRHFQVSLPWAKTPCEVTRP